MCMWNGEWKQFFASHNPRQSSEWRRAKKCICYEWLLIFFFFNSLFYCQGRLYSSTIINFIHRNNMKFPMVFAFFWLSSISSRAEKITTLAMPTIKVYFIAPHFQLPSLERKPIIDGIINVINLHNQYLFLLPGRHLPKPYLHPQL